MKNVIINQQNAVSGFPTAPPTRVGISPVSPSRARHAAMLLLVFLCQTPASPGRVTRSPEALTFVPLPRLILLENGANRYSCQEQELSVFGATGRLLEEPGEEDGDVLMGSLGRWVPPKPCPCAGLDPASPGDKNLLPSVVWLHFSPSLLRNSQPNPQAKLLLSPKPLQVPDF